MSRVVVALILLSASACGKSPSPVATPGSAAPAAPAATSATTFTLGEATVVELLDKQLQPVSRPLWKLHTDGKTERTSKHGEWQPDLVEAKADGTIWLQGQQVATVTNSAITYAGPDAPPPIAIDGDTLSVVVWQKAHDGEDFTAKVELAGDGTITVHHRDGVRAYWKIEASDPAVMRTAFHVFALSMKAILD